MKLDTERTVLVGLHFYRSVYSGRCMTICFCCFCWFFLRMAEETIGSWRICVGTAMPTGGSRQHGQFVLRKNILLQKKEGWIPIFENFPPQIKSRFPAAKMK